MIYRHMLPTTTLNKAWDPIEWLIHHWSKVGGVLDQHFWDTLLKICGLPKNWVLLETKNFNPPVHDLRKFDAKVAKFSSLAN